MAKIEVTNAESGKHTLDGVEYVNVTLEGDLFLRNGVAMNQKFVAVFARGTWRSAVKIEDA
jgi:hypothetical protein